MSVIRARNSISAYRRNRIGRLYPREKIMKKIMIKPRAAGLNAALLSRKSGAHQKTKKATRKGDNVRLQKEVHHELGR